MLVRTHAVSLSLERKKREHKIKLMKQNKEKTLSTIQFLRWSKFSDCLMAYF